MEELALRETDIVVELLSQVLVKEEEGKCGGMQVWWPVCVEGCRYGGLCVWRDAGMVACVCGYVWCLLS